MTEPLIWTLVGLVFGLIIGFDLADLAEWLDRKITHVVAHS